MSPSAGGLSFYWHDYETFGREPRRHAPAQFAGVRTDAELNEIGEPLMVYCRPPLDALPDPESCLLTGITPQHCARHGLPEKDFAAAILKELAAPGTIGVGYNSLRFDDEVSRFLFWRNLIEPYGREWQNGCSRWDLLDVVRAFHALRPEGIEWPRKDDGRPSLKLEHLSAANGLMHEAAHDALSDVRATIALARLLRSRNPKLFDYCLKLRDKNAVWAVVGNLTAGGGDRAPLLHISGMFGAERGYLALVWPLIVSPANKNELLVWDLAHDPRELLGLDVEALRQRLFTRTADLPEGVTRLPLKGVHVNKSPVLIRDLRVLRPGDAQRWGLDVEQAERHAELGRQHLDALLDLPWRAVYTKPPSEPVDVDHDLYGAFLSDADRRRLNDLRQLDDARLLQARPAFEDARLEELFFRYRARQGPEQLSEEEQARWQAHRVARLVHGAGGGLTLSAFQARIDELAEGVLANEALDEAERERQEQILGDLADWAEAVAP